MSEETEETVDPLEGLKSRDIDRENLKELAGRDDVSITTRGEYKSGAKNYYLRWRGEEEEDQTSVPKKLNGAVWGILGKDKPEKVAEIEGEETASKFRQKMASDKSKKLEEFHTKQDVARRQLMNTLGRRVYNYVLPKAEKEMDYTKIRREANEKGKDPDEYLRFIKENVVHNIVNKILNYYDEEGAEKVVRLKRKNELLQMRIRELKRKTGRRSRGAKGLRNDIVNLLAQRMDLPQRRVQDLMTELFGHKEGL